MQFRPVSEPPIRRANCRYKNLRHCLNNFMRMDERCVQVEFSSAEFANVYSAHGSFNRMIRLFNFPIKATVINSELYLVRTDMED